jgi:hypothetical protein
LNEYADGGKAVPAGTFVILGYDVSGTKLTHYFGAAPTGVGDFPTNIPGDADTSLFIGTRDDCNFNEGRHRRGAHLQPPAFRRRARHRGFLPGKELLMRNLDPSADTDQDGLTNAQEEPLASDPTNADSDDDGINDGAEVNQYKTSPVNADSDGDILSDGMVAYVLHTDPAKSDSDGDSFNDHYEVHLLTDPLNADSKPKKTLVNVFTGPDPGEGLDLDGNFVYAVNTANEEDGGHHDAVFTTDAVDGVTVNRSQVANGWDTSELQ